MSSQEGQSLRACGVLLGQGILCDILMPKVLALPVAMFVFGIVIICAFYLSGDILWGGVEVHFEQSIIPICWGHSQSLELVKVNQQFSRQVSRCQE